MSTREINLWTYQDAVEWLVDSLEGSEPNTDRANRLARKAIHEAYRDLPTLHNWTYLYRRHSFATVAQYSTGTVVYDHTGGAYSRMLTLTTGTWPSWAAFGRVVFGGNHYDVATRESDSIITLSANSNPGDDVASTTYRIYRSAYPLPIDYGFHVSLVDEDGICIPYATNEDAFINTEAFDTASDPDYFTVRGDGEYYGSLSLVFTPPPSAAERYMLLYGRTPRPLRTVLVSGTCSLTAGQLTVTGSGFDSKHVGSIIRFSSSETVPTSVFGTIAGTDNPYLAQRAITAVSNSSTLTIDATVSSTTNLSGVGFTISDPLDFEHRSMLSVFLRLAEEKMAMLTGRKDYQQRQIATQMAIRQAVAADWRDRSQGVAGGGMTEGFSAANGVIGTVDND